MSPETRTTALCWGDSVALFVGMRDRIGALNGELEITSAPGHGTIIAATVQTGQSKTELKTTSSVQRP